MKRDKVRRKPVSRLPLDLPPACDTCGGDTEWGATTTNWLDDAGKVQSVRQCRECYRIRPAGTVVLQ